MLGLLGKQKIKDRVAKAGAPVIIGATGGSGTRLFQAILDQAGFYLGDDLNGPGDAMFIEPFVNEHVNSIMKQTGGLDYSLDQLSFFSRNKLLKQLGKLIEGHLNGRPEGARWGWKHPRSYFLLPLLKDIMPEMKFVHIVRDGRDMATSSNQNQPKHHYEAIFNQKYESSPVEHIRMWSKCNLNVADWAKRELNENYLRIRLEDICENPTKYIKQLLDFVEVKDADITALTKLVKAPDSLGRWKKAEWSLVKDLEQFGAGGLARFNYIEMTPGMSDSMSVDTAIESDGALAFEFLKSQGLQDHQNILDIGADDDALTNNMNEFLSGGRYLDVSSNALKNGGEELSALQNRKVHIAIAQTLFTQSSINSIRHYLNVLYPSMQPDGVLYVPFLFCPDHHNLTEPLVHPVDNDMPLTSYDTHAPYHYTLEDMEYCAAETPWKFQFIGDWNHPRNVKMGAFILGG